jgi:hypothetical protein
VSVFDLLEGIVVVVSGVCKRKSPTLGKGPGTYEVTGISPQSMTLPQKLNGLDFIGLVEVSFWSPFHDFVRDAELTRCTRH